MNAEKPATLKPVENRAFNRQPPRSFSIKAMRASKAWCVGGSDLGETMPGLINGTMAFETSRLATHSLVTVWDEALFPH